jgi:hypothetical protein
VGSVLIDFGANTGQYFAGSKSVKSDASSISSTFGGVGGSIAGVFAGIGAALSAGALIAGLKSAGAEVVNLAKDADKLSVSTEALSRLRFAAKQTGVDAETLSHAMLKLQENVGKAAAEGGEAAAKIQALGLNVRQLANESPDQQFKDIAQAISLIQNPSQRAAAEVALFGKAGAELKPLLEQGAAGLATMSAEADRLGITVSSVDAESTLRASKAVDKLSDAISGIGQHIAIGLAPYIEDVANRMVAWAETGNHVQKILNGALEAISYGAAAVIDLWKIGESVLETLGGVGLAALSGLVAGFDLLYKAGSYVINKLFGTDIDTTRFDKTVQHLADMSANLFKSAGKNMADVFAGDTAAQVLQYFDSVQQKAQQVSAEAVKAHEALGHGLIPDEAGENLKKIKETLAALHKEVDDFGLSEGAKKLAELKHLGASDSQIQEATILSNTLEQLKQQADVQKELAELQKQARQAGLDEGAKKVDDLQSKGATGEQIAEAKRYQAQIEAVTQAKQRAKQLDEEAKKAREDSLTPMQKEQAELQKLRELYDTGRISAQEFASAAAKKDAELHGEDHNSETAVTRGSEAAFKLINDINKRANGGGDKKDQIAQQQLRAQDKTNDLLAKLLARTNPKAAVVQKLGTT